MAAVSQLVLVTWLIHHHHQPRVWAVSVTEFRPVNCPTHCLCGVGTSLSPLPVKGYFATVSCPNRKLADFPARLPAATSIAVLRGNALRSTVGLALPPRLAELDLSYNVIDDVTMTSQPAAHLSLRHLDLRHNVVERLSSTSFKALPRLRVLLLGYNRINARQLNTSCFRPLNDLRWLSLAGNRLTTLTTPRQFTDHSEAARDSSLTTLTPPGQFTDHSEAARDSSLTTLTPGQFHDVLPQLGHLDLSCNDMEDVADDALSGLRSLRELDLSHNRVSRLTQRSFVGLESLAWLDLTANRLQDVPAEALKVFEGLSSLILDDNRLTSLPSRCLAGLAVRLISVSHMTRLRFVDAEAFFDVKRLTTIALHDNPRLAYVSEHLVVPQSR